MNGKLSSTQLNSELIAISDYVKKGDFVRVNNSEAIFIQSLTAKAPYNCDGKIGSLRRCGFLWLKEIGNAVSMKNLSMLEQAYNEFMWLHRLIDNMYEETVENSNGATVGIVANKKK